MIGRVVYFIVFGWWLGILAAFVGYLLCLTIIGLPLGTILMNRLPTVIYLREPGTSCPEGYPHRHYLEELPILLRILWFFLIGWEAGFIAIVVGYVLVVSIIGLPLGIFVLNRVPLVMTLSRHYG